MAGNSIKVNTSEVGAIASELNDLNHQLSDTLQESKQCIESLRNVWESQAADLTIRHYEEFAAKYFNTYEDIIDQYVQFLRRNVEAGYFITETANEILSEAFH